LCKRKTVKEYNLSYILKPLVRDLKIFEENGINFEINGIEHNIKGFVSFICGDNLGLHEVLGFNSSFNSGHICRWCYATYDQIQKLPSFKFHRMRNNDNFSSDISKLLEKKTSKNCGIIKKTPFSELKSFDISIIGAPDLMHDVLEGVLLKTINLLLKKLLNSQEKTSGFNRMINNFHFSNGRIREISFNRVEVCGSASQILDLFFALPQLLIKEFTSSLSLFRFYEHLHTVTTIILSDFIEEIYFHIWLKELESNVDSFLKYFKKEFTEATIIPKFHYLTHYSDLIKKFGPVIRYSCMRFERKHLYFKSMMSSINCYKNITKTLTNRHQRLQSIIGFPNSILRIFCDSLNIREISSYMIPDVYKELAPELRSPQSEMSNNISVNGIHFLKKGFYAIDLNNNSLPNYVKLNEIYINDGNPIMIAEVYLTLNYNKKIFAYRIQPTNEYIILTKNKLITYKSFKNFNYNNAIYIRKTIKLSKQKVKF
jgi:hypothetical protein